MYYILLIFISLNTWAQSYPLDKVKNDLNSRGKGIVVMDLDETIIDSHSRKYHAFKEALIQYCGKPETTILAPKNHECEALLGLSKIDFYKIPNGYSLYELLGRLKISHSPFIARLTETMVEIYMSGSRMEQDSPMPGATTYVRELKRLGAQIIFITARYEDSMTSGSLKQLKEMGFMQDGEEMNLILRKRGQLPVSFKKEALERVILEGKRNGLPIVGLFENEPENLNVWKKSFPEATAVLIKGNMLVNVKPSKDLFILEDYR